MLTNEERKKYIENGGVSCSHCGSTNIEAGSVNFEGGSISQKVVCLNPDCNSSWYDVYKLVDIEED